MVVLLLAVYWLAARRSGGKYLPAALAFTVFISFNAVLFNQYFAWLIPFILLMVADYRNNVEVTVLNTEYERVVSKKTPANR